MRARVQRLLLRRRGRLTVGRGVRLGPGVRIEAAPGARVVLGDGCRIGDGTRLAAHAGEVRIGADAMLGDRCIVVAHAGIEIAAGCRLGDWVTVTDFEPIADDPERPTRLQGLRAATVRLGDGAIVDHCANVLTGVTVGAGARVGAHAVVARDVPAGGSASGASPGACR